MTKRKGRKTRWEIPSVTLALETVYCICSTFTPFPILLSGLIKSTFLVESHRGGAWMEEDFGVGDAESWEYLAGSSASSCPGSIWRWWGGGPPLGTSHRTPVKTGCNRVQSQMRIVPPTPHLWVMVLRRCRGWLQRFGSWFQCLNTDSPQSSQPSWSGQHCPSVESMWKDVHLEMTIPT